MTTKRGSIFPPTFFPAFFALFLHHHFRLTALAPTGIRRFVPKSGIQRLAGTLPNLAGDNSFVGQ